MGEAAHEARLVAHADLAHVHADVERGREVLDQLAEVHAVLGRKVEHGLLATEEILHAHGLHLEAILFDEATEVGHGVLALDGEVVGELEIALGGHAQHGLEGLADLGLGDLEGIARDETDLGAALGGADGVVALDDVEILRIEPQVARGESEFDGYD